MNWLYRINVLFNTRAMLRVPIPITPLLLITGFLLSGTASANPAASGCTLGGGTANTSIAVYISAEVKGTNATARNATDTLDDTWRTAAGLPTVGTVVPWFGYRAYA